MKFIAVYTASRCQ